MATKRKRWDPDKNVFIKVGSKSTWEYQGVDPEHGPIDVFDVGAAIQKYKLHIEYKTKAGKSKGTQLFATYIYRAMVEERKYDGNAEYYQLDEAGKEKYKQPKNAWKPVDDAIKEFNKLPEAIELGYIVKMEGKMIDHTGEKNKPYSDEKRMAKLFGKEK
jgi:hypothetical protein